MFRTKHIYTTKVRNKKIQLEKRVGAVAAFVDQTPSACRKFVGKVVNWGRAAAPINYPSRGDANCAKTAALAAPVSACRYDGRLGHVVRYDCCCQLIHFILAAKSQYFQLPFTVQCLSLVNIFSLFKAND